MVNSLRTNQYTINWKDKQKENSAVFKFFLTHLDNKAKDKLTYWIPFSFRNKYYLMTFNNCYSVSLVGDRDESRRTSREATTI